MFYKLTIYKVFIIYLYFILIGPFFYNYFHFLPQSVKYLQDLTLIIGILLLLKKRKLILNTISKKTLFPFISLSIVCIISAIYNNSNLFITILSIRTYFHTCIIVLIISHLTRNGYSENIYLHIKYIFITQIILIPIEYLVAKVNHSFYSSLLVQEMELVDIASGTFGLSTSIVSISIILFLSYVLLVRKEKWAFFLLIPLSFTFSGGANILLVIIMSYWVFKGNFIKKTINIFLATFTIILLSTLILNTNLITESTNYILKTQVHHEEIVSETLGVSLNGKLARFSGYKYLIEKLTEKKSIILGFGPDAFSNSDLFSLKSSKLDEITEILTDNQNMFAMYGILGLLVFYYALFKFALFLLNDKININYDVLVIFIIFFLSTFYIKTTLSQQILVIYIFIIFYVYYNFISSK